MVVFFLQSVIFIILIISIIYLFLAKKRLAERNEILDLLLQVNKIILSTSTNFEQVTQKISDAVSFELGFKVGVVMVIDKEKNILRRVAISRTKEVAEAVKEFAKQFKGLETPLDCPNNIAVQVALDGKTRITHDSFSILSPHFSKEESLRIQQLGQIATSMVFPIASKGIRIGVMVISLGYTEKELSKSKLELISRLVNVVGIALENALLYERLRYTGNQLSIVNQRLKELDKLKDEFVSVASHELRTPMTAIRSYAWMALNRSDVPLSKTLQKYVVRILMSTERLINMVNDMLNVSRIESGRIEINPEPVDILSLVKDIIDEVYFSKFEEKHIEFVVLEQPIPKVFADPGKLRQVLLNLVGNSMKFTPDGGKITFSFFSDGNTVDISVIDTGVGITKEDISKLFRKFSRLDNSYVAAATSGGTGLGLYISKSLLDLMHGKISVSSEGVGRGTTFKVTLPSASPEVLKNAERYKVKSVGQAKQLEPVAL